MMKAVDKLHLDLNTPLGRGFIPIAVVPYQKMGR